jgi:pimeloyl-ACP methyl ester carboxylesterase
VIDGPLARCGPQPVAAAETGFEYLKLRDRAMGQTPAITAGSGRTVVVLLHQTDGGGLCGWLEFATTLATDPELSVLAIDLCGYGESRCTADAEPVDPVELALRHARAHLKAERIIMMGASMGGSVALISAATLPGIDSAIDLSGPVEWQGMEAVREGKKLPVPVLVAMADDEGTDQVSGAQRIVDNAPAGSEFLPAEAGHGYELLNEMDGSITPIGERVLRWLAAG